MLWRRLESKPIQHVEILNVQSGAHLKNSGAMGRQKESMKKSKLDWKGVGQFMAMLVQVWTIIRQVVVRERVDFEILDWITGEGEQAFRNILYMLTDEYNKYKKKLLVMGLVEHVIDFDAVPTIRICFRLADVSDQIASRVRGKKKLSDLKLNLYLDDFQAGGGFLEGYDLKTKLEGQKVLGAQLLDFYLEHPDLIPKDWNKKLRISFWGTIYRGADSHLYVRCLCWNGMGWDSEYDRLNCAWFPDSPAAVSASPQV